MRHLEVVNEQAANRLFAQAQEELISHLLRSNVTEVAPVLQQAWLSDTITYLGDRYRGLSGTALHQLRVLADDYLAHGTMTEPARRTA
ncbi:MAG TPA: hypothetical protein VFM14_00560 [Gemmatimonadales bacterium]|nr:hypothetical protein [Gemmatimonadales bacterium]